MQVNDPPPELTTELVAAILGRHDVASITVAPSGQERALLSTVDTLTITLVDGTVIDAVAKRAAADRQGAATIAASGAYRRELDLYAGFLATAPLPVAPLLGIHEPDAALTGSGWVLLLGRVVGPEPDQVAGLSEAEATRVLDQLITLHRTTRNRPPPSGARCHPIIGLPERLREVWPLFETGFGATLTLSSLDRIRRVVDRAEHLSEALGSSEQAALTHADPRADNLILGADVVLLDWQQATWQHPAADLAWLIATSIEEPDRALIDRMARHHLSGLGLDDQDSMDWFRHGLSWPLLQFTLLAARPAKAGRRRRLVDTTVRRIAGVADLVNYDADTR
ncbi:MAG: aminoglycoside phosphotransferase family protein [Actinomycetia bacterium]|nr:aminoglycoside phosphotransferase family protein [Actinomycetes bacterium]